MRLALGQERNLSGCVAGALIHPAPKIVGEARADNVKAEWEANPIPTVVYLCLAWGLRETRWYINTRIYTGTGIAHRWRHLRGVDRREGEESHGHHYRGSL